MHHCECDHRRLSYCGKCRLVHCLDCKQEWSQQACTKPHWSWPPYYWQQSPFLSSGTYTVTTGAGSSGSNSATISGTTALATTCEHDGV